MIKIISIIPAVLCNSDLVKVDMPVIISKTNIKTFTKEFSLGFTI